MRSLLFALGILLAAASVASRAEAQNYPWCANYGDGFGGTNCGFATLQQCQATISGIGGDCRLNTQYQPPVGPAKPRHRPRHSHSH
jgi:hypothetical protein